MHNKPNALRRVSAGVYETADGARRIIRSEAYEGPNGGTLVLWELAYHDGREWVIDSVIPSRTLREARARL